MVNKLLGRKGNQTMLMESQKQMGSGCLQVLDTTILSAPTPSQTPALFLQPPCNPSRGLSNETAQGQLNFTSLELSRGLAPKPSSSKAQQIKGLGQHSPDQADNTTTL